MAFTIKYADAPDSAATIKRKDTPDSNLRRVFRFWRRGEHQLRPIADMAVALRLSILHYNDISAARQNNDVLDEIIARYIRRRALCEQHRQNEMRDMVVVLRLSLMRTLWEKRGYLDLPYIDSVIRQTLQSFKNRLGPAKSTDFVGNTRQTQIKPEYTGVLADMCWGAIEHAKRVEAEQEQEPVDITDSDIDAWINSEMEI